LSVQETKHTPSSRSNRGVRISILFFTFAHFGLTVWIIGRLPFSTPRGPTPFEEFLQYALVALHPVSIGLGRIFPHGLALVVMLLFLIESLLWGLGITWAILRLRRMLA